MKILVAIDGSQAALDALRHTLGLLQSGLQAQLLLVTVQPPTYVYETLAPGPVVLDRLTGAEGSRALEPAEAMCREAGVRYLRAIASGEAAWTLLQVANSHSCNGIVMGARGLGSVKGFLLGSVSQEVLRSSSLPVTIVRAVPAAAAA